MHALRSYFDDPEKANKHIVQADGKNITFTGLGDSEAQMVDTAFSALRFLNVLETLVNELDAKGAFAVRLRSQTDSVKFAVGEQCLHSDFGRVCVIGWDPVCKYADDGDDKDGCINDDSAGGDDPPTILPAQYTNMAKHLPRYTEIHVDQPCR